MRRRGARSVVLGRLTLLGVGLAALWWIGDSIMYALIVHESSLGAQIYAPAPMMLVMRVFSVFLLVFLGAYAESTVTERKRADEALSESEARYRTLFEKNVDGVALVIDGKIAYANPRLGEMVGYSADEIHGRSPMELVAPEEREQVAERVRRLLQNGPEYPSQYHLLRRDGGLVPVEVMSRAIQYDGKSAILSVVRDITERKRAEEALRESEEEFRLAFQEAKDAIFWADPETGLITKCNKAAEALLEKKGDEIIGAHQTALHPPEKAEYFAEMFKKHLEREGVMDDEAEVIAKSGRIVPVHITASVTSVGGKPIIQGIFRDITERKRMEEALQRAREELEGRVERQMQRRNPYGLTFRELTVLHHVAEGRADKEIACKLAISPLTVSKHVANILAKMDAGSRTEAGVRAFREGLLE